MEPLRRGIHPQYDIFKVLQIVNPKSEKVGDGKRLVNRARENVRVKRVLADGAFDSKANFN
jgi:hypothetical protein